MDVVLNKDDETTDYIAFKTELGEVATVHHLQWLKDNGYKVLFVDTHSKAMQSTFICEKVNKRDKGKAGPESEEQKPKAPEPKVPDRPRREKEKPKWYKF